MIDGNDATFAMSTSDGVKLSQVTFTEGGIAIPNPQNLQAAAWCQHDLIVGWYPIMRGGSPPPCCHPQDPNHVPRNLQRTLWSTDSQHHNSRGIPSADS
jgi:hypothetical protein